jgi:hemerythrin-like domain-containing protein/nucleotide-binding universal stress UspA family protein
MYQHLLVPIDDTPLATVTVAHAVRFAKSLGATITFFHAAPDLAATGDGALLYSMDGGAFADAQAAQGQAELLKARTAAEISGVKCETLVRTTAFPARAIHETAQAQGCDLIFLSAHGCTPVWRGITVRLMEITQLPVLVATVESNQVDLDMYRALGIVSAEHRSIAAVVHGMQQTMREARRPGHSLDTTLLHQMVDYLGAFPAAMHHPKEEEQLFRLLRRRCDECEPMLQELERAHRQEAALIQAMAEALARYEAADASTLEPVWDAMERLAGAMWEHMEFEEAQLFPAADRHLLPEDWSAVAQAFTSNVDPLRDVDAGRPLAEAFARISTSLLAAPPAHH